MVIKIPKPPYSKGDLRNYDTSRTPTFLGRFFHDKAVEFQQKEKELISRKEKYDIEHINNAKRFFKQLLFVAKIPQKEKEQAASYAVVTLEDAAIMCGIDANKLWRDYVKLGILPMHDGNVPVKEFLKLTILLKNVMYFFSEQERIRRRYKSSYKEIIKDAIREYARSKHNDATQILNWLSFYFNMSEKDAVEFESATAMLYHFFEMKSFRIKEETPVKKKRRYRRCAVSIETARELAGVSVRRIKNWDKGINMPEGYPGRGDAVSFDIFINELNTKKRTAKIARAINKAESGGYGNLDNFPDDETNNPLRD